MRNIEDTGADDLMINSQSAAEGKKGAYLQESLPN